MVHPCLPVSPPAEPESSSSQARRNVSERKWYRHMTTEAISRLLYGHLSLAVPVSIMQPKPVGMQNSRQGVLLVRRKPSMAISGRNKVASTDEWLTSDSLVSHGGAD